MSMKTTKGEEPQVNKPQIAHSLSNKRRTGDISTGEKLDFAGLFLSSSILQGLSEAGFRSPSPIQLKAIPLGRCGLDLIVQAKSGTGKTCVFTVIALEGLLLETSSLQVLILAPTREIALQIQDVILTIGQNIEGLQCHSFIGGLPLSKDKEKIKKCHIAVGTPGRVKQLIEQNILATDAIRLFILDEADKLLEEGFQEQINWIYSTLPENKQMVALSATYPEYLANHLTAYMRNPTFVRLNVMDPALLGIKQFYQEVPFQPLPQKAFEEKSKSLIALLSSITFQQCLVFSNLQVAAENLSDLLNSKGWPSAFIAGSQDQMLRMKAMEKLKKYECRVLISTDLTSRGIDADKVDLVVNLDLPWDHETYLHRIGRAGRFGAYGAAVSFVVKGKESTKLKEIQEKCKTYIKALPDPIPSNLTQPTGHVCLDDMVTTEQLITVPKMAKCPGTTGVEEQQQHGKIDQDKLSSLTTMDTKNGALVSECKSTNDSCIAFVKVSGGVDTITENRDSLPTKCAENNDGNKTLELLPNTDSTRNSENGIDLNVQEDTATEQALYSGTKGNVCAINTENKHQKNAVISNIKEKEAGLSVTGTLNDNDGFVTEQMPKTEVTVEKSTVGAKDISELYSEKTSEVNVQCDDTELTLNTSPERNGKINGEINISSVENKPNGVIPSVGKGKTKTKEKKVSKVNQSRELRSYSDLDFDFAPSTESEIPEFGVDSSPFGASSRKSKPFSSKLGDQSLNFCTGNKPCKSRNKKTKSGKQKFDSTLHVDAVKDSELGFDESLLGIKSSEPSKSTSSAVGLLRKTVNDELAGNTAVQNAATSCAPQNVEGSHDKLSKKLHLPNQMGTNVLSKLDAGKIQHTLQNSAVSTIPVSIANLLKCVTAERVQSQKKEYATFAEAKANFLKLTDTTDISLKSSDIDSKIVGVKPSHFDDLDITVADISHLLQEFHKEQESILSGMTEISRQGMDNGQDVKQVHKLTHAMENGYDVKEAHNSKQTIDKGQDAKPMVMSRPRNSECSSLSKSLTTDEVPLSGTCDTSKVAVGQRDTSGNQTGTGQPKSLEPNDLIAKELVLTTDQSQVEFAESVSIPKQEVATEKSQSCNARPVRKRRAPSEDKKRRGMAGTLAFLQGRVESIPEGQEADPDRSSQEENSMNPELELAKSWPLPIAVPSNNYDISQEKDLSCPDLKSDVCDLKINQNQGLETIGGDQITNRRTAVGETMSTEDETSGEDMFIISDGVVLRVKRPRKSDKGENSADAVVTCDVEDDDNNESEADVSDSSDSDSQSGVSYDSDESYSTSEESDTESSETETADFVDDDGLCYRRGYSKVEQQQTIWSEQQGANMEISGSAEVDLDFDVQNMPQNELNKKSGTFDTPIDLSVRPKANVSHYAKHEESEKNCDGSDDRSRCDIGPPSYHENLENSDSIDHCYDGQDYSEGYAYQKDYQEGREDDRNQDYDRQKDQYRQSQDPGIDYNNTCNAPEYRYGAEYSQGPNMCAPFANQSSNPQRNSRGYDVYDQNKLPGDQSRSYAHHPNNHRQIPEYSQYHTQSGPFTYQRHLPGYQSRSYDTYQNHNNQNKVSGDQSQDYRHHPNHHGYSPYQDSPHYEQYMYHLREAQRLEQVMRDEQFNKKMEKYMHKAYVIQSMCLDHMKEYRSGKK